MVVVMIKGMPQEAKEEVASYIKELETKVADQEGEIKRLAAGVENVIASRVKLAEKDVADFVAREIHALYAGVGHYTAEAKSFIEHIFDKAPDHMKPVAPPVADVAPPAAAPTPPVAPAPVETPAPAVVEAPATPQEAPTGESTPGEAAAPQEGTAAPQGGPSGGTGG